MNEIRSTMSPGHIVVPVRDMGASLDFYRRMELPAFLARDTIALIELRGGTHILLVAAGSPDAGDMEPSRYGQMPAATGERFDLMLDTDARPALEAYRKRLVAEAIEATPINENEFFGHWFFQVRDPDGNLITVYTSHEIRFMKP